MFNSVFPYVVSFANVKSEEGISTTEIILVGSNHPINYENIEKSFKLLPLSARKTLYKGKIVSGRQISGLLLFTSEDMRGYGAGARLVTDDNSLLEFSTAKNLLVFGSSEVIEDINNFIGVKD